MQCTAKPGALRGDATIPGSKSNTTRAVVLATLAPGRSVIHNPVHSVDCYSTVEVCRTLGAKIEVGSDTWIVDGVGPELDAPSDTLHVGNSGTTLYVITAVASHVRNGWAVVTGDYQIRRRPSGPLVRALNDLGAKSFLTRPNSGAAPIVCGGPVVGGSTSLPGVNSQWLTPLLMIGPLTEKGITVEVDNLQERPYIDMTLRWLKRLNVEFTNDDWKLFRVPGGQKYEAFDGAIPSDWESACFPLVSAAITDSDITLHGLDMFDAQGDKDIIRILKEMGADVEVRDNGKGGIRVRGGRTLHGISIDCGDIPDAPPILSVLGTQAEGRTVLHNLHASRLKETDRPRSIYEELLKMGGKLYWETDDTLVIEKSELKGAQIDGRHDHRIVMATACAALVASGTTTISNAEYVKVSFPTFYEVMTSLGAPFQLEGEQDYAR